MEIKVSPSSILRPILFQVSFPQAIHLFGTGVVIVVVSFEGRSGISVSVVSSGKIGPGKKVKPGGNCLGRNGKDLLVVPAEGCLLLHTSQSSLQVVNFASCFFDIGHHFHAVPFSVINSLVTLSIMGSNSVIRHSNEFARKKWISGLII